MKGGVIAASRRRTVSYATISYVGLGAVDSNVSGGNLSIPYPASIAAGDLLWMPVTSSVSTVFGTTAASGFTRRFSGTSGGSTPSIAGFYKIATGSESGSITVTSPGGATIGRMFAYRNVNTTTPFDVSGVLLGSSTGITNYDIPTQTPTVAGCVGLIMACGNSMSGSWTTATSYTELYDGGNAEAQIIYIGHRLALTTSATGTRTPVRSGSVRGAGAGEILRPAFA